MIDTAFLTRNVFGWVGIFSTAMGSQVPGFPPLAGPPRPVETPVDTTQFVELTEDEERLPKTTSVRKNLALQGRVNTVLLYPFTFTSNTLTLGYLWSTYIPTPYTGIGIRHHPELSADENRLGIETYHYILDEIEFTSFLNKTTAACGAVPSSVEQWKEALRTLTGNCLVLLLRLKKMRRQPIFEEIGDFPLLTKRAGLKYFLCGLWEELWATAHQMAPEATSRFGTAALVRACAAYYYYTEAAQDTVCPLVTEKTLAVAKDRLRCILIGWIIERIPASREVDGTGQTKKWADIPWPVEGTLLSTGKYRAAVFSALGVVVKGKPVAPPFEHYTDVFRKAVLQCETNLLSVHNSVLGVRTSSRTFSSLSPVDPYAECLKIGEAWAEGRDTALFEKVAHLKPHGSGTVWGWTSDTEACPPGLEVFYSEGSKRYAKEQPM